MTDTLAPYCMINDNIIMLMLIINMIGVSYVLLMNGQGILERLKCIFYYENKSTPFNDRRHITRICNIFLYIQVVLYAAIITISCLQKEGEITPDDEVLPIFGIFILFYTTILLTKRIIYDTVNKIIFTNQIAQEWKDLYFFTIKLIGFMLMPIVMTILFIPAVSFTFVKIYLLLTLLIHSYTLLSSLKKIIFIQNRNYLDIFLYLCALEFLPTAMAWKFVLQLNEFITIKI